MTRIVNAMSVDVEDYYHVSAFDRVVPKDEWTRLESRVEANTERLLDFLGDRAAGDAIRSAVREPLAAGCGTPDLGLAEQVGTAEFARRVLDAVGR